jgi:PAS domain S-box-containing protein
MKDEKKTRKQLIEELNELRQCVAELKGFGEEIKQTRVNHEKFTKAFLQNSVPASITTLKEGRFIDVSNVFLRLTGCKRDEVIGYTSIECGFITEEQRASFYNELNKKGRIENLEMKVRTKGGTLRDGLFNAVMMSLNNEKYLLAVITDITERKQAEEALRKSEGKYRSLIENINDGIYILDSFEKFTFVNDVIVERFGYPAEWFLGRGYLSVISEKDRERVQRHFNAVMKGKTQVYDLSYSNKSGNLIHVEVSTAPLFDGAKVIGLLGISRDITDRKSMEGALAEEHQMLSSIMDGSPVSSFVIDRDRRVTAWNMVNEFFTGISKEDILGKPLDLSPLFKGRVPPALADLVLEMSDEEIMKRHGHKGIRKSGIHPQAFESIGSIWIKGKEHIMAIQATRLRDAAGNVIGAIQCAQDITMQKRSEEKLRKSEQKYRNLFENAAEGIYQVSPEGRFISANPAAAHILGYESPEELISTITDIGSQVYAYPEDRDRAVALLKKDGFFRNLEVRNRRKNGSIVWVLANVRAVQDDRGNILYHEGTSSDITEQKTIKDALERLVKERTAEIAKKNKQLVGEIKKCKSTEAGLLRKERELHLHSIKLQQLNAALKVLLRQREEDRRDLEEKVLSNVKHLINPNLETLKKRKLDPDSKTYLDILEQNLKNIISPFSHTLSSKYQNLTPAEIKVANMIRNEKTTKEMAEFMGVSVSAINHHRYHIRGKLGILTQKINLRSHLLSLS